MKDNDFNRAKVLTKINQEIKKGNNLFYTFLFLSSVCFGTGAYFFNINLKVFIMISYALIFLGFFSTMVFVGLCYYHNSKVQVEILFQLYKLSTLQNTKKVKGK